MNVLYLTNGFPWPLTSGYLRHYFLLRELSREHDITLLSIVGPGFTPEDETELAPFTKRIRTFAARSRGGSFAKRIARLAAAVGGADPAVEEMRRAVEELARAERFDVVFCGKRTRPAIAALGAIPLVADMCDATSSRIRRSLRFAGPLRAPLLLLELARTRQVERAMMAESAHSIFISCRDREDVLGDEAAEASARAGSTTIMPNGVDVAFWKRKSPELGRDTIAFTGAMDYRPNTDAALFLVRKVMPLVRREIPKAELLIVGRDPTPALQAEHGLHGVTVTGFVDDVREWLERATVFAAPIRFGAGIQNKVLEAMAMELPVVATPLAADGLRTEEGLEAPLMRAASEEEFAARLIATLRAKAEDRSPDAAARAYVETNFVWATSAAKLDRVLRAVSPRHPVSQEDAACSPSR